MKEDNNVFGATTTGVSAESIEDDIAAGRDVLAAAECGVGLPTMLLQTEDGTPYRPVQLSAPTRHAPAAAVMQLTQWLMRPDAAGGHAAVVAANKSAAVARITRVLLDRLALPGKEIGYRALLQQTRDAAAELAHQFEATARDDRDRMRKAEERKRRYQLGHSGGLRGLFGGLVSLSEAVQAFNTIELADARCAAADAAVDVMRQTTAMCERILAGVDEVRGIAETAARAARAEAQRCLRVAGDIGRPADYVVSPEAITRWVCERAATPALLGELIGVARVEGGDNIAAAAHSIAEREVTALLNGQDLPGLIQIEATATPLDGITMQAAEGAVRIASHLVKLVRQARPGVRTSTETSNIRIYQVTAGSMPFFRHPELAAASFAIPVDELAFVRVESDLALNDVVVMRDGAVEFERAWKEREFFVLEELTLAHAAAQNTVHTDRTDEEDVHDVTPDVDAWAYLRNELRERGAERGALRNGSTEA